MAAPTPEAIEKARVKLDQAKARFQRLEARASVARRKLDARRKIILGALVMDAARSGQWPRDLDDLMSRISRDVDLKAFEGWTPNDEQ